MYGATKVIRTEMENWEAPPRAMVFSATDLCYIGMRKLIVSFIETRRPTITSAHLAGSSEEISHTVEPQPPENPFSEKQS
jgi:hypothetical protein